jgi:hypothetical protein
VSKFHSRRIELIVRSLLIVGVLLALCISEGVGLQLLPIPDLTPEPSSIVPPTQATSLTDSSRHSLPNNAGLGRVEIVAPKLKKLSIQLSLEQDNSIVLLTSGHTQYDAAWEVYRQTPPSLYAFNIVCRPASRAPPRSI